MNHYQAFACYDLLDGGKQKLNEYGIWTGDRSVSACNLRDTRLTFPLNSYGLDAKGLGQTQLNLAMNLIGAPYQSGALFSYSGTPTEIIIRVGVSFVSADQACSNAESEIGSSSFENIVNEAKVLWNEKLSKIEIDVTNTPANITEMFYSSLYRASLTPVSNDRPAAFRLLTILCRITRLVRLKECSRTHRRIISTPCTAGMW